jgi:tetratricopeptide (TPR) repeat protein
MEIRSYRIFPIMVLSIVCAGCILFMVSCSQSGGGIDIEQNKRIAGELRDNKLFRPAIDEYKEILEKGSLDSKQKGSICYLIGRVYFEDLKDFENAASYYMRAREYDPNADYNNEASKNLVASLEKLGHLVDAKRELGEAANIKKDPQEPGDVPVAKIAGEPIWKSEIEKQIQALPAQLQKKLLNPEEKMNFIHQYVGIELMLRAAKREGYDRDPEILQRQEMAVKNLLVQKYVLDKVMPEVRIDSTDVKNFYAAHKTDMYKGQPFDSVKAQVFLDYQNVKTESAYSAYISRLAASEQVEFLDQNVK